MMAAYPASVAVSSYVKLCGVQRENEHRILYSRDLKLADNTTLVLIGAEVVASVDIGRVTAKVSESALSWIVATRSQFLGAALRSNPSALCGPIVPPSVKNAHSRNAWRPMFSVSNPSREIVERKSELIRRLLQRAA